MIPGVTELSQVFNVLVGLDVVEDCIDLGNAANYAMAYAPDKIRMQESGVYEEEEMIDEEAEIIFICDHGVQAWFDKMDAILLGELDE